MRYTQIILHSSQFSKIDITTNLNTCSNSYFEVCFHSYVEDNLSMIVIPSQTMFKISKKLFNLIANIQLVFLSIS